MQRPSDPEIYRHYAQWCRSLGVEPAAYETWSQSADVLSQEEIARHEADKFLSKLHPDGSDLAGFHKFRGLKGPE